MVNPAILSDNVEVEAVSTVRLELPVVNLADRRELHITLYAYTYAGRGTPMDQESFLVVEEYTNQAARTHAAVLPLSLLWSLWPNIVRAVDGQVKATIEHEARRLAEGAARQLVGEFVKRMMPEYTHEES